MTTGEKLKNYSMISKLITNTNSDNLIWRVINKDNDHVGYVTEIKITEQKLLKIYLKSVEEDVTQCYLNVVLKGDSPKIFKVLKKLTPVEYKPLIALIKILNKKYLGLSYKDFDPSNLVNNEFRNYKRIIEDEVYRSMNELPELSTVFDEYKTYARIYELKALMKDDKNIDDLNNHFEEFKKEILKYSKKR